MLKINVKNVVKCDNSDAFVDIVKNSGNQEIYNIIKNIKYELLL